MWCTTCGRILNDRHYYAERRRWVCPGYAGDGMDEETAAALRVGPFDTRVKSPPPDPMDLMPGFVKVGPNTWERTESCDVKAAYQKALREQDEYFKKHRW